MFYRSKTVVVYERSKPVVVLTVVRTVIETKCETDYYVAQFFKRHVDIRAKVNKFNLAEKANCNSCKTEETAEHV